MLSILLEQCCLESRTLSGDALLRIWLKFLLFFVGDAETIAYLSVTSVHLVVRVTPEALNGLPAFMYLPL